MRRRVWSFVVTEELDVLSLKHFCNNENVKRYAWAKHNSGALNYRPHYHFNFLMKKPIDCYQFTRDSGFFFAENDIPSPSFNMLLSYFKRCHTEQDVLVIDGKRM